MGIVGGFDVANFGDVLFPMLAEHELGIRLETLELVRYGYRDCAPPEWPYEVRSLARLPDEIDELDLLLVGGGFLVRSDTAMSAEEYRPEDPRVHHPLGLWLTPTLVAAARGVPVAWNAVGVSPEIAAWTRPLVTAACAATGYISVRDQTAARSLAEHAGRPAPEIHVVPDTAFGIEALLPGGESQGLAELCQDIGLTGRYLVVQPAPSLRQMRDEVVRVVEAARASGLDVVELPIGPVHGDAPGMLDLPGPTVTPREWLPPWLLAELVANADAAVGLSLHLSIVAASSGVPMHRPLDPRPWKYETLDGLEGVHTWPRGDGTAAALGRTAPEAEVRARIDRLRVHWDAIATLAQEGRSKRGVEAVAGLVEELPHSMDALATAEREGDAERDRLARESDALASRLREVELAMDAVTSSASWRLTAPLRRAKRALRRPRRD